MSSRHHETRHVVPYVVQVRIHGDWCDELVTGSTRWGCRVADEKPQPARVIDRNNDDKVIYENRRAERLR